MSAFVVVLLSTSWVLMLTKVTLALLKVAFAGVGELLSLSPFHIPPSMSSPQPPSPSSPGRW